MSKVKYCPNCGNKMGEEDIFCSECGTKLEEQDNNLNEGKTAGGKIAISKKQKIIICSAISLVLIFCLSYFASVKLRENKNNNSKETAASVTAKAEAEEDKGSNSEEKTDDSDKDDSKDDKTEKNNKAESEEKLTAKVCNEKEIFAGLLRNKDWLTVNAEYGKAPESIRFLCLDVNNDGVSELLLAHEGNSGLAGLTLSVIFCDPSTGNITRKDINTSHGGYVGFIRDKNTIVVNFSNQGYSMLTGWKVQGNEFVQDFKTEDDIGRDLDTSKAQCKINDNTVDYDSYMKYVHNINNSLVCTTLHPITEKNIESMLNN